jgi:glycosyltransferase involved in cell wall biosynthesis
MLQVVPAEGAQPTLNREKWHNPLVSIIVTHYNYSEHLEGALLSIIDQTHDNWECVVVDDCSDPDHRLAAEAIIDGIGSSKIKLIALRENRGQISAFFVGLDATSAQFVSLLDPDDRYEREFLKEMVEAHLNETVYCPIACSDQMLLQGSSIISRTNHHRKIQYMQTGASGVVEISTGVTQDKSKRLFFIEPARTGWHWTSSSSMMFRRPALELMRPRKPLSYKAFADSYLAKGAHMLGGSLFLTKPLVYRGVHRANTYIDRGLFGTFQSKQKEHGAPSALADVREAIEANGAGHELKKSEKRTAWNRWRRSLRKRLAELTR